jgi:hypothetical protein
MDKFNNFVELATASGLGSVRVSDYFNAERPPYRYALLTVADADAEMVAKLAVLGFETGAYLTCVCEIKHADLAMSRPLTAEEIAASSHATGEAT